METDHGAPYLCAALHPLVLHWILAIKTLVVGAPLTYSRTYCANILCPLGATWATRKTVSPVRKVTFAPIQLFNAEE